MVITQSKASPFKPSPFQTGFFYGITSSMETIDLKKLIDDALSGRGPKGTLFLLIVVVLLPIFTFGYGAYHAYDYWDLKKNGIQAQGEIVRVEKERSMSSSHANFYPVVRFEDADGNLYEQRAGRAGQGKYKAGDTDDVYYDAENPERFILDGVLNYGMKAFLLLMALGAIGSIFILNIVRQMRQPDV